MAILSLSILRCVLLPVTIANVELVAKCSGNSVQDCGRQVGQQMRHIIREAVLDSVSNLLPYLGTSEGKVTFDKLLAINKHSYPDIAEEYIGIAEGASLDTRTVFIAALANELTAFAKQSGFNAPRPKSCTDYHIIDSVGNCRAWGHNEDNAQTYLNRTFRVEARIRGFSFTGFAYAPNVVGWAWGFNSNGIAQSINALFPDNVTFGIGVNFLARDVLNAISLDDAIARACTHGVASGQNFNIGSVHEKDRQILIETSPLGCSIQHLSPLSSGKLAVAYHANRYESSMLKGIDSGGDSSSQHRMTTMHSIAAATSIKALRGILSDVSDPKYPIHRSEIAPDSCLTMNSVIFDVVKEKIFIWGLAAPAYSSPIAAYDWRTMDFALSADRANATVIIL